MNSQLFLLRHGLVQGGQCLRGMTDDKLSAVGFKQMQQAVLGHGFDVVITSPLLRCLEFAEHYAKQHHIPYIIDKKLQEINFGDWDGLEYKALFKTPDSAVLDYLADPWRQQIPNGENMADFSSRVKTVMQDILMAHATKRILVVTHGGVMRQFIAQSLNIESPNASAQQVIKLGHGSLLKFLSYQDENDLLHITWQL